MTMINSDRADDFEPDDDGVESFVTPETAVRVLGISRHPMGDLIRAGRLTTTARGLVSTESIEAYLASPTVQARRARDAAPKRSAELLPGRFPIEPLRWLLERHEGRVLLPGECRCAAASRGRRSIG